MIFSNWARIAAVALASASASGCGIYSMAGWTTPIETAGASCERVLGFNGGTEDAAVDPKVGGFYVSADPRREKFGEGGIWLVRPKSDGNWSVIDVTGHVPVPMHPHGIDFWQSEDGAERRLFVINHGPPGKGSLTKTPSRIEIFDILEDGHLRWRDGDSFSLVTRPNDLVAVGPTAFYIVNDHRSPRTRNARNTLAAENRETLLRIPGGDVVYVENGIAKAAYSGLAFPAGVTASEDGLRIYVGESSAGKITSFDRLPDNTLKLKATFKVGPMPDNLTFADGGVWYGAHSRLFRFLGHAVWPSIRSPGRVEVLDPQNGKRRLVLRENGTVLSTLSSGVPFGDKIIIGSIDQPWIGVCQSKSNKSAKSASASPSSPLAR